MTFGFVLFNHINGNLILRIDNSIFKVREVLNRGLGNLAYQKGEYSTAKRYYEESLSYARMMDDKLYITYILSLLSEIALIQKEYEEANELVQQSLTIAKHTGELKREVESVRMLGIIAYDMGKLDEADKN